MVSIRLVDLAKKIDAQLYGDSDIYITGIASINSAKENEITFLNDNKYLMQLENSKASAVILKYKDLISSKKAVLVVKDPYLAYAKLAKILDTTPKSAQGIHQSVVLAKDVHLGVNVSIGANSVVESGVFLGNNVSIGACCFIGKNTIINKNTHIWSNVSIYHNIEIGSNCLIQSGTIIGSDGFGYANEDGQWIKIPQLGKVIIGDNVEIGASTTIDRGSLDDTIIGDGVIIDNQCQIAHNVSIGDNTAIAGGVVMGGSLKIGQYCMIGGASVVNGHIEICDKVVVTGMSMVMRSINKSGVYSSGIPLQANNIWRKTAALVMNINKLVKRLKLLERKIFAKFN